MFALLIAAAVTAQAADQSSPSGGQGQTIETAQAFLRNVMMRGTSQMALLSENLKYFKGWTTVETVSGSGCSTTFTAQGTSPSGPHPISRTINWSLVSEVSGGPEITVSGQVRVQDGRIVDGASFQAESDPMQERILKAMNFLREHCDATQGSPF